MLDSFFSWLVSKSLDAASALAFADPACGLCVLDFSINDKSLRLNGMNAPNNHSELPDFFRRIEPFLTASRLVVLVEDENAVLDPDIDRIE